MGLTISKTHAQMSITTSPSKLEIETQNAKLELRQKHAKVNIHTELPKVHIDQYEAFASAGLMNYLDLTEDAANRAYRQVMEYIAKVAGDGDMLAAIENGGNPIAEFAIRDAYPEREYGIDFIPKAGPKFSVTGSVQIDPERNWEGIHNGVEGSFTPGIVKYNYSPSKVNISMVRYPSVDIRYEHSKIDTRI